MSQFTRRRAAAPGPADFNGQAEFPEPEFPGKPGLFEEAAPPVRTGAFGRVLGSAVQELNIEQGKLQVRLARTPEEIDQAQRLRYRVFYEEMTAQPSAAMAAERRDFDPFDEVADHLLVIHRENGVETVVGTYRLIRREAARLFGRFYSSAEYDLGNLLRYQGEILELGRSCVDVNYRNRPTMQMLWRGIAGYVSQHDVALMFGCASLPGTDPHALAQQLSYLHYHHLAPPALRPRALAGRFVDMNILEPNEVDPAQAIALLPPLVKGYVRLGGFVGEGAVIDPEFNTTDICIVVKTDLITERYYRHYERRQIKDAVS